MKNQQCQDGKDLHKLSKIHKSFVLFCRLAGHHHLDAFCDCASLDSELGASTMHIKTTFIRFSTAIFLSMALAACTTQPQPTIQVMSSGGFTAAYKVLGPMFEKETGIRLVTAYGASGGGAPDSIPERLKRGEYADVVILSKRGLGNITKAGHVEPSSQVDLARSGIGMAVLAGAAHPDIRSKT
ncbi:MAG: substrate-binding domain-containing protein, partial [Alphaproteobacteria bacterium]|nr:substrate-binding domain-containing protein [Alphaproteobacteria bacterium]